MLPGGGPPGATTWPVSAPSRARAERPDGSSVPGVLPRGKCFFGANEPGALSRGACCFAVSARAVLPRAARFAATNVRGARHVCRAWNDAAACS